MNNVINTINQFYNNYKSFSSAKFNFEKKIIIISIGGTSAGLFLIEKSIESILNQISAVQYKIKQS